MSQMRLTSSSISANAPITKTSTGPTLFFNRQNQRFHQRKKESMSDCEHFDVGAVAMAADAAFAASKGAEGLAAARRIFEEALKEWVGEVAAATGAAMGPQAHMPGGSGGAGGGRAVGAEARRAQAVACAQLWVAFAAMERGLKQWKAAVAVYDQVC